MLLSLAVDNLKMSVFIDPLQLPSIPLSELNKLPDCTAIYFAMDSQNRVLYVGQDSNLVARCKNHHRKYQLEQLDKISPVRVAWQTWNEEDLSEAEKYLIKNFQPLLNWTEVKSPTTIPSEVTLREFLKAFSQRLIVVGIKPRTNSQLLEVHLKYDWENCSPKGTAAKIKTFAQENKNKNTSLKFKWNKYGRILPAEVIRPGSRAQKVNARQNRSYNNHWQVACNGVIIHITPTDYYQELKSRTGFKKLAGVKLRAVTESGLSDLSSEYSYDLSLLFWVENDPIPLLWVNT